MGNRRFEGYYSRTRAKGLVGKAKADGRTKVGTTGYRTGVAREYHRSRRVTGGIGAKID